MFKNEISVAMVTSATGILVVVQSATATQAFMGYFISGSL